MHVNWPGETNTSEIEVLDDRDPILTIFNHSKSTLLTNSSRKTVNNIEVIEFVVGFDLPRIYDANWAISHGYTYRPDSEVVHSGGLRLTKGLLTIPIPSELERITKSSPKGQKLRFQFALATRPDGVFEDKVFLRRLATGTILIGQNNIIHDLYLHAPGAVYMFEHGLLDDAFEMLRKTFEKMDGASSQEDLLRYSELLAKVASYYEISSPEFSKAVLGGDIDKLILLARNSKEELSDLLNLCRIAGVCQEL